MDAEEVLRLVTQEVEARESYADHKRSSHSPRRHSQRSPTGETPTAYTFINNSSAPANCVFCNHKHRSETCSTVPGVDSRKKILGRCYICLRKHHVSRHCRSSARCEKCQGRHHLAICYQAHPKDTPQPKSPTNPSTPGRETAPAQALEETPCLPTHSMLERKHQFCCRLPDLDSTTSMGIRMLTWRSGQSWTAGVSAPT